LLEWDDGEDRSTDVLWLQTPTLFADIRIPAGGGSGSEGFAGHLAVTGQLCRWHRPIDVKPKGGDGDVGVLYRRGSRMIECGVHRNYLEDWRLIGDAARHLGASRGAVRIGEDGIEWPVAGLLEIVVAVDGHLIHAWRGHDGAGIAYGRLDSAGRCKIEKRAGPATRTAAPGDWLIWSAAPDAAPAERILSQF
jgi:hypothetical protein